MEGYQDPNSTAAPTIWPIQTVYHIHRDENNRKDSIERSGTSKQTGWKVYVDMNDAKGTKERIDAAMKWAAYVDSGGDAGPMGSPPEEPK